MAEASAFVLCVSCVKAQGNLPDTHVTASSELKAVTILGRADARIVWSNAISSKASYQECREDFDLLDGSPGLSAIKDKLTIIPAKAAANFLP